MSIDGLSTLSQNSRRMLGFVIGCRGLGMRGSSIVPACDDGQFEHNGIACGCTGLQIPHRIANPVLIQRSQLQLTEWVAPPPSNPLQWVLRDEPGICNPGLG